MATEDLEGLEFSCDDQIHTSTQIAGGSQLSQGNTRSQSCLKVLNLSRNNLEVCYYWSLRSLTPGPWLFDEHLNLQN